MYRGLERHPLVTSFFLGVLAYAAVGLFFGFYYGWVDEVNDVVLFSGLLTGFPQVNIDHNIFVANILVFLYGKFPYVAWYGIFMHLLIFISMISVTYSILSIGRDAGSPAWGCFIAAGLIIVFFLEVIAFFNITYVSMLATIAGFIGYTGCGSRRVGNLYLLLIVLAILIRAEAALFVLFFLLLKQAILKPEMLQRKRLIPLVLTMFITFSLVYYQRQHPPKVSDRYVEMAPYLYSLEDATTILDERSHSREDSMILTSVINRQMCDLDLLERFIFQENGPRRFYEPGNILQFSPRLILSKLKSTIRYASSYPQAYNGYNWGGKLLVLLLFICCLYILLFISRAGWSKPQNVILSIFVLMSAAYMLLALMIKLEYRVIQPMLLLVSIWLITELLKSKDRKLFRFAVPVLFLVCGMYQLDRIAGFSLQKQTELESKRSIQSELNEAFRGKTILYDVSSVYLMHDTPFRQVRLSASNRHMICSHFWLIVFRELAWYYEDHCGSSEMQDILACYYRSKDSVLFVSNDYSMRFLSDFTATFYNARYEFRRLDYPAISDISYSYMSVPLDYGYFEFD